MSTLLTIRTDRRFDPRTLSVSDLRWSQAADGFRLHRAGVSTRVTTVIVTPEETRVEIRALASDADIDLAVAVAASLRAPVEVEGVPVAADQLEAWFDAEARASMAESGARALKTLVQDGRGPITVPGPLRDFIFGDRLLAELDGPEFAARLIERIHAVQWDVPSGYRDAGVFVTGDDGKGPTVAIWMGCEDLVLPNVQFLVLSFDGDAHQCLVPADEALPLAGEHGRRLDERQLLVDRFEPAAWDALLARASRVAVDRIG